jgi:hypothetical protein
MIDFDAVRGSDDATRCSRRCATRATMPHLAAGDGVVPQMTSSALVGAVVEEYSR